VKRVPPVHSIHDGSRSRRVYRYWDPAPPGEQIEWITEDELERFDLLLDQAVNRCLDCGPTAIYLSGGLDSVSIAAIAADNSRQKGMGPPLALSLVFPDPECNEEETQRSVAKDLGLPQILMDFDSAC